MEKAANYLGIALSLLAFISLLTNFTSTLALVIVLLCSAMLGCSAFGKWKYRESNPSAAGIKEFKSFLARFHVSLTVLTMVVLLACTGAGFAQSKVVEKCDSELRSVVFDVSFASHYFQDQPKLEHQINGNHIKKELMDNYMTNKTWDSHLVAPYIVLVDGSNGYLFKSSCVLKYIVDDWMDFLLTTMLIISIFAIIGLFVLFICERIYIAFHTIPAGGNLK